ncbi:uncharacterized protein [Musca autumnalis]|uniref:uncharacterized protein n=1 Tax=Musca autumnalis TaxID=221902 RepID=UPI003CF290AF
MGREELMEDLKKLGIAFPDTATITQLRDLLRNVVGDGASGQVGEQTTTSQQIHTEADGQAGNNVCVQANEQTVTSQQVHTDIQRTVQQEVDGRVVNSVRNQASEQTAISQQIHTNMQTVQQEAESELQKLEKQLQMKLRLLKLQNEINELEAKKVENKKNVNFVDVEGAIMKFTGDDNQSVAKWTKEFERVTSVIGCNSTEQFLFARRMMAGSASLFMRSSNATTWEEFKKELNAEFTRSMGVKEALKKLENRKWHRQAESLHRYTLIMQELAEDTPINEAELVEYIVEGIQDKEFTATIPINYTTLAAFKKCIPKYEPILKERGVKQAVRKTEVRCYNCQQFGHYSGECKREYRPKGTCYKCGKMGHFKKDCPERAVAALNEEEVEEDEIGWRMKPVQLYK